MKDVSRYLQISYADDSCAGGLLPSIREWFDRLVGLGPLLGYVPEPTNCHLIVSESNMDNAKLIFCDTGVNIVTWVAQLALRLPWIHLFLIKLLSGLILYVNCPLCVFLSLSRATLARQSLYSPNGSFFRGLCLIVLLFLMMLSKP